MRIRKSCIRSAAHPNKPKFACFYNSNTKINPSNPLNLYLLFWSTMMVFWINLCITASPSSHRFIFTSDLRSLHPGRLTWNLQITHLERKMIFQTPMIMFHVNLPGCTFFRWSLVMTWTSPSAAPPSIWRTPTLMAPRGEGGAASIP